MACIPERLPVFVKGGATKFTELSDAPSSYSGQAGKAVKVKTTEDGLEFGTVVGGKRTATKIVAANDSLDKTLADYVCDGTADQEEINAAINALPTFGGRVLLLEGTYNISAPITILKNNVTLEGQGAGTKLFLVNGSNCSVIKVGNGSTALEGFRIANLKIDGNKGNQTSSSYGIYFYGDEEYLITKSIIENCIVENCLHYGIYLLYSDYNIIRGNQANSNGYAGIHFENASNNTITGNQANSNGNAGIYVGYSYNDIITGNQANSNGNAGIYVSVGVDNIIIGNQAFLNGYYGIYLTTASHNTINDNQAKLNGLDGIYLNSSNNNTIIGNKCKENYNYGLNISDSSSCLNFVVKNYLTGNTAGSFNDSGEGTIKEVNTTNDNVV